MPSSSTPPSLGDLHDEQIETLLRSGAHAALMSAYFGDVAYRELSHLAKLAAIRRDERGPSVFILPGIMGSRLGRSPQHAGEIWLHPAAVAEGSLAELRLPSASLHAVGIMLPGYLKLKLSLEIAGFRPVFHPFDWRSDLIELGRELLQSIRASGERRVMVIAHSMGGLVARAALGQDADLQIAKLVQLGAPNAGSYAPVQAMRAVYPTVRKIAALDRLHSAEDLVRNVFLTLPGLYQLLPALEQDFFDPKMWPRDELAPNPNLLRQARASREQLAASDERCFLIAGVNQETIVSAQLRDSQLEYTVRRAGDGTVSLASAHWKGARTWYVAENHGGLTNNNIVLAAIDDILRHGDTQRLSTHAPAEDRSFTRQVTDAELRRQAVQKVRWESLSLDSRRRILDPVFTIEFQAAAAALD
ncbi:MAG: lipase family alpha/beta hydrolase [Povalibacter sp.]